MVNMTNLLNMEGMMLIMILIGVLFSRKKIITKEARRCLTDVTINLLIPCNMIAAFLNADRSQLAELAMMMVVACVVQVFQLIVSQVLYRKKEPGVRSVMRYSTLTSNAGFLGNPMVEGMYGQEGLVLASVALVPIRLFLWTAGLACYVPVNKKNVVKTALTHPCILSVIIGILLLLFPVTLPTFVTDTISSFSTAMTPMTMLLIGCILAEADMRTLITKDTVRICFTRLVVMPACVLIGVKLAGLPTLMASVMVVLIAMPVATTTAILADRYDGDAEFATKLVVLSTILSLITIPVWSMILEMVL